jgi:hypothetical protein
VSDGAKENDKRKGRSARANLHEDARGAVFVEFLIAFLPVYVFFLCVVQVGLIFSVRLVTEHAAINGARALAVVGGDEPKRYSEKINEMSSSGKRRQAVRSAVLLSLAPLILNGVIQSAKVFYPRPDQPDGADQGGTIKFTAIQGNSVSKVRVRVEVDAACRLAMAGPIACNTLGFLDPTRKFNILLPTVKVRAEAIFPYQGAQYEYP